MSYATLQEFRAYLKTSGGPTAPTGDDSLLQQFLDEASGVLRDFVGHPLDATTTTTRRFDAVADVEDRLLLFDCGYCAGITAVVNGDGVTVPSSAYVTEPRNVGPFFGITLKTGANYTWTFSDSPEGAIQVTGYWCYSENANGTPDAITRGATLQLAAWLYRTKDQVAELSRPAVAAEGVTVLPMALPQAVLDRLRGRQRKV